MENLAYNGGNGKRGIDDPGLNQDLSFNKKDNEDFDDTDDFHKFDETDDEEKNIPDPRALKDRVPLNIRLRDKETNSTKNAGLNDGNIYI